MSAPVGALVPGAAAAPSTVTGTPGAPLDITAPAAPGALAGVTPDALAQLSAKLGGGKAEEFAPLQQIQMPQVNMGQSQQIAAALAKAYGLGV